MKLENQVVSLELAKRLKELGVNSECLYQWTNLEERGELCIISPFQAFRNEAIPAFTVAELGEMLKTESGGAYLAPVPVNGRWNAPSVREVKIVDLGRFGVMTEADARAKMLIYLIENGLYEPKK